MIKYNIVITGGSGFLGSSIKKMLPSKLNEEWVLHFPTSKEMNLLEEESVKNYFASFNTAPVLTIHCAGITPAKWSEQEPGTMFKNLLMFEHVMRYSMFVINFSSGAVFNRGENIGREESSKFNEQPPIPKDEYGMSKFVMEQRDDNVIHMRAWGIFGPDEKDSRMIKRNILRYMNREKIEIHQDVKIDYFSVYDLVNLLSFLINEHKYETFGHLTDLKYDKYTTLSEISRIINGLSTYKVPVQVQESGWGKSYYTDDRWLTYRMKVLNGVEFLGLEKSIQRMYKEINERT